MDFFNNNGYVMHGSSSNVYQNSIVTESVTNHKLENYIKDKNQPTLEQVWEREKIMAPIRQMEKSMSGMELNTNGTLGK